MAHQPSLLSVDELKPLPMFWLQNFADSARFCWCESGTIQFRTPWEHIGSVVIPKQEDVILFLHSVPEPDCGHSRIAYVITKIIEIIAKEYHAIIPLRFQPVIGVGGMMMEIGNEQRAHRTGGSFVDRVL